MSGTLIVLELQVLKDIVWFWPPLYIQRSVSLSLFVYNNCLRACLLMCVCLFVSVGSMAIESKSLSTAGLQFLDKTNEIWLCLLLMMLWWHDTVCFFSCLLICLLACLLARLKDAVCLLTCLFACISVFALPCAVLFCMSVCMSVSFVFVYLLVCMYVCPPVCSVTR